MCSMVRRKHSQQDGTHHREPSYVRVLPLEILQQKCKLCNKEVRMIVGFRRVCISLAVQVYARRQSM